MPPAKSSTTPLTANSPNRSTERAVPLFAAHFMCGFDPDGQSLILYFCEAYAVDVGEFFKKLLAKRCAHRQLHPAGIVEIL